MVTRGANGKWLKGHSPNPGGRPAVVKEVQELARQASPEAIDTLRTIMRNTKMRAQARVAAANSILDRGLGKPPQSLAITEKRTFDEISDDDLFAALDRIRAEIAERTGKTAH